jgi:peptidoglycan/LPS O-acetylase OafA/YrhL
MKTIGSLLDSHKGFGPGFHYMRVSFAILIVAWHAHYAAVGNAVGSENFEKAWIIWFVSYAGIVMFFVLGGFLIAGSAVRLSLKEYFLNRFLRIMPALGVEVLLSMLIIGPIFTVLPLTTYFSDYHTWAYLTNIIGVVNYFLPGVFVNNPAPEVNNALWTIPFEYFGYVATAVLVVLGFLRRPALILAIAALFIATGFVLLYFGFAPPEQYIPAAGDHQGFFEKLFSPAIFLGRGSRLIVAFLFGIAAYACRYEIPYEPRLFFLSLTICLVIALAGPAPWLSQPALSLLACPALVYVTIFLGVTNPPRVPLLWRGDYSYGIYLYGFPIQQSVHSLIPTTAVPTQFVVAMGPILLLSVFSWHFIEEPALRARRRFTIGKEKPAPQVVTAVSAQKAA